MQIHTSNQKLLEGTSYKEVQKTARKVHNILTQRSRRQPYIRSKYFSGDKVFLHLFWTHVMQKHRKDRTRRLKLFAAGTELIMNSRIDPETIFSKDSPSILLHRFYGVTRDKVAFCVQIKQDKKTGRKDLMSIFERKHVS
jgi:hypothetical protein